MDDQDITCPTCGFAYPIWVEAYVLLIQDTGYCPFCMPRCPQTGTYPVFKMLEEARQARQ